MTSKGKQSRYFSKKCSKTWLIQPGTQFWKQRKSYKQTHYDNMNASNNVNSNSSGAEDNQFCSLKKPITPCIRRTTQEIYDAALSERKSSVVPTILRPIKKEKSEKQQEKQTLQDELRHANGIVDIQKLPELYNHFFNEHRENGRKLCLGNVSLGNIKVSGLCLTLSLKCNACGYVSSDTELFNKQKRKEDGKRPTGELNLMLSKALLYSKIGINDAVLLLNHLDIHTPSVSWVQKLFNYSCDVMKELNKKSMIANQQFVREVKIVKLSNELRCSPSIFDHHALPVAVQTDLAYNNRCTAGYEASQQADAPLHENETSHNLLINLEFANKMCSKSKNSGCNHESCSQTMNPLLSIASCEKKLTEKNIKSVDSKGILKVHSLTTDACGQMGSVKTKAQHETCVIHRFRNLFKQLRKCKFHIGTARKEEDALKGKLCSTIRNRMYIELKNASRQSRNKDNFMSRAKLIRANILKCVAGEHRACKQFNSSCFKHHTAHMELNNILKKALLDNNNNILIQSVLNKVLSDKYLGQMMNFRNTNKAESFHHRFQTLCPKTSNYFRNAEGLAHSAGHIETHGAGTSALLLAKKLRLKYGIHGPMTKSTARKNRRESYDRTRQSLCAYRCKRYFTRLGRCHRKVLRDSAYKHEMVAEYFGVMVNKREEIDSALLVLLTRCTRLREVSINAKVSVATISAICQMQIGRKTNLRVVSLSIHALPPEEMRALGDVKSELQREMARGNSDLEISINDIDSDNEITLNEGD